MHREKQLEQEESLARELARISHEAQRDEKMRQHIKENRCAHDALCNLEWCISPRRGGLFKWDRFNNHIFIYSLYFSVELRELESKLKSAYLNRERAAQIAEKEALRFETMVRF